MTISELTFKSSAEEPVRRFEVFTGAGRRRDWSAEDKARIVAESLELGASVSAVARRHALSPQQLFAWRRAARQVTDGGPMFVPAVLAPEARVSPEPSVPRARPKRRGRPPRPAAIEVDVAGVRVRIESGASPATIAAVLGALKVGP
jgi:transposase